MEIYSEGYRTRVLTEVYYSEIIHPKIETLSFHVKVLWEKVLSSLIVNKPAFRLKQLVSVFFSSK